MKWIDIRARKPTEADADEYGDVLQLLANRRTVVCCRWNHLEQCIAWQPIEPFDPPKIPEGWRVVDKAVEKKTDKMKFWGPEIRRWLETDGDLYNKDFLYITPTEPKYRPFANAAEFRPFASREWRYKSDHESVVRPPLVYSDGGHDRGSWEYSLDNKIFCDGTPFGMKEGE